jgi:hypothetical protein
VRDVALAAFTGRRRGIGIGDIIHDSLLDDLDAPADEPVRRLWFSDGDDLGVRVFVKTVSATERDLVIQTTPPTIAELDIGLGSWRGHFDTNAAGHVSVTSVPSGLLELIILWPDGKTMQTAHLRI